MAIARIVKGFKFQSDSINTGITEAAISKYISFKFQSDSINTNLAFDSINLQIALNSNLILLIPML